VTPGARYRRVAGRRAGESEHTPANAGTGAQERAARATDTAARLATLIGRDVVDARPAAWGFTNRTTTLALRTGERLVVHEMRDRAAVERRVQKMSALAPRLAAAGIVVPRVIAAAPDASPPFVLTDHLDGRPGGELLEDPTDAIALGTEMGRLLHRLWSVPIDALALDVSWSDGDHLHAAVGPMLAVVERELPDVAAAEIRRLVDGLPAALAGREPVLAHGDWVPVNVLVDGRVVVAVLDWDQARLADRLLDVAWWAWVVGHHHPRAFAAAWPAFLETAGVDLDPPTVGRIRGLAAARLLEAAASAPPGPERERWLRRLAGTFGAGA